MIYVFDNSSLSSLKHFYPNVFGSVWDGINHLVEAKKIISTKEVFNEMENGDLSQHIKQWIKENKKIFTTPAAEELQFVAKIFGITHFRTLIGERQRLKGNPVADPFVIACAKVHKGTVVTEEKLKPYAAKIPNVCAHFDIKCINLEEFMKQQKWSF